MFLEITRLRDGLLLVGLIGLCTRISTNPRALSRDKIANVFVGSAALSTDGSYEAVVPEHEISPNRLFPRD